MKKNALLLITLLVLLLPKIVYGQLPQGNLVYMNFSNNFNFATNDSMFNYDPTQPVSATNPALNTIVLPPNNCGLAISPVLGSSDTTLTYYTTVNGKYWYYDHNTGTWVNTGDSIIISTAVNIGAGGGFIYSLRAFGNFPNVYKYDGTGDATYLTTVTAPLPYDLMVDCSGNFYIISLVGPMWSMRKYSPAGVMLQGYTVSNPNNWAPSGGCANLGSNIYTDVSSQSNFIHASLSGTTVTFNSTTADMPFMVAGHRVGDMASVAGSLSSVLPSVSISAASTIICPGDSASFTSSVINSSPGSQYQWYVNGALQTSATDSSFQYLPMDGDTVTLHYSASGTCGAITAISAGIVLHVISTATHIDYGTGPFCANSGLLSPVLSGSTGGVYSSATGLSINAGTGVINTIASTPGTYVITYTSGAGGSCVSTALDTIVISPQLQPGFTYTARYGCTEDTVVFNNTSAISGNQTYLWQFGDQSIDTNLNPIHLYTTQGVYDIQLVVNANGCSDTVAQSISLLHPIAAGFSASPDTVCLGKPVLFNNTSAGTSPSYFWSFGDGSNDLTINPVHSFSSAGIFQVKLLERDFISCVDSVIHMIYVDSMGVPGYTISDPSPCIGEAVIFTSNNLTSGVTGILWNFGDNTVINSQDQTTHAYEKPGTYPVSLTASYQVCPDTTLSLSIFVQPNPVINAGNDTSMCAGNRAIRLADLTNAGNPFVHWLWSTGDTTSAISVTEPGIYYATISIDGCSSTDTIVIRSDCDLYLPNVFSPNGDGLNDVFKLMGITSQTLESFKVFNRWGQIVYFTNNATQGWNGMVRGEPADMGVYQYLIQLRLQDPGQEGQLKLLKGDVSLIR